VPYDVKWTLQKGDHGVAMETELSDEVMSISDLFSNITVLVPTDTAAKACRLIPHSLDPSEHRSLRKSLNDNLGPKPLRAHSGVPARE